MVLARSARAPAVQRAKPGHSSSELPVDVTGDPTFRNAFDLFLLTPATERPPEPTSGEDTALPSDMESFFASRSRTPDALVHLLRVQGARGDWAQSERTLAALPECGVTRQVLHYNHALAAASRAGNAEAFDRIHKAMVAEGLGMGDAYTWSSAAACYMRGNQPHRALQVVARARAAGVSPDEVLYGALLTGFAARGDYEGADAVWTYLSTGASDAPRPDTVLYTSMIHACAQAGQAERALMLFRQMQEGGLVPTLVTYNAVLLATARRVDLWRQSKEIFAAMQEQGALEPSAHTMNTMLLCAARAGDLESCRNVVRDMERAGLAVTLVTLNTWLNGVARAHRQASSGDKAALLAEADAIFARIERHHVPDVHSLCARLNVYVAGQYLERAVQWFATLPAPAPLVAWTTMLKLWSTVRRPQRLSETLDAMREARVELDAVAYRWVIEGYARAYHVKSAVEWVGRMVDAGLEPTRAHTALLYQRCNVEDLRQARRDLEVHLARWRQGQEARTRAERNRLAAQQRMLAGEEAHLFLLPHPTSAARGVDLGLKQ